jgi:hypothetical protein
MRGRFTYKLTWAKIVKLYRLTLDQPDTVLSSEGKRTLVPMREGLIPGGGASHSRK